MTPTAADLVPLLLDTSAAVPFLTAGHPRHAAVRAALGDRPLGLSGHAAFETYSVLTRLPAPTRRPPSALAELFARNFPQTRFLSQPGHAAVLLSLPARGISGGAVYDALVAATATEHGLTLATRDLRATATYEEFGADLLVLD